MKLASPTNLQCDFQDNDEEHVAEGEKQEIHLNMTIYIGP
jgi:hypothetical protein